MNALVFLLIALVLSGIGSAVLVFRNRRPTSVESGVDEFRREMNALAPPERPRRPRQREHDAARIEADLSERDEPIPPDAGDEAAALDGPEPTSLDDDAGASPADPQPPARGSARLRPPADPGTP
ncbi:MAG TPA: hypothetical protein VMW08_09425 [Acidimicrobiales bacterium]|nr:hypothetical protein [Acidimicrobiales bacterium]